jgi:hypothetical protein
MSLKRHLSCKSRIHLIITPFIHSKRHSYSLSQIPTRLKVGNLSLQRIHSFRVGSWSNACTPEGRRVCAQGPLGKQASRLSQGYTSRDLHRVLPLLEEVMQGQKIKKVCHGQMLPHKFTKIALGSTTSPKVLARRTSVEASITHFGPNSRPVMRP